MTDAYAILVGISRYADSTFGALQGPVRDVELMKNWLMSPSGGSLPQSRIKDIVSDESAVPSGDDELPPVFEDFFDTFMTLIREPNKTYIQRPASRLYLYFSGHGFSEKVVNVPQAALYVANTDKDTTWNIFGTHFARWTKDQDLFGEIVLIMDCCRDAELTRAAFVPPLRKPTGLGVAPRLFELYAAPRGGNAQERAIPSRGNQVHGLLTHSFLHAIDHAAPTEPRVSSSAMKRFLEEQWPNICAGTPADPPELVIPSNGEIAFERPTALPLDQRFVLVGLAAGDTADIYGNEFALVARLTINASTVTVSRGNDQRFDVAIRADRSFVVPIWAGLYAIKTSVPTDALKKFQAGAPSVEL